MSQMPASCLWLSKPSVVVLEYLYCFTCVIPFVLCEDLVYSVTFETCSGRISGTDSDVLVFLYNQAGEEAHTQLSGQGDAFNMNRNNTVQLSRDMIADLGPICQTGLKLMTQGREIWKVKRIWIYNIPSSDRGFFLLNQCHNETAFVSGSLQNYSRQAPQWLAWSECDCKTNLRLRIRQPSPCEESDTTQPDIRNCRPTTWICGFKNVWVVLVAVSGVAIILGVIVAVACVIKCRRPSPSSSHEEAVDISEPVLRRPAVVYTKSRPGSISTVGLPLPAIPVSMETLSSSTSETPDNRPLADNEDNTPISLRPQLPPPDPCSDAELPIYNNDYSYI